MKDPICIDCQFYKSTSSGDRCTVRVRERPAVVSPIDGTPGWQVKGGDFTSLSRWPLCFEFNTLKKPCQLYLGKESADE